jgi:hypothetical protein
MMWPKGIIVSSGALTGQDFKIDKTGSIFVVFDKTSLIWF